MQIRGNRMTIAEENILNREPTVSEIAIKFPEWHLTRGQNQETGMSAMKNQEAEERINRQLR